MDQQTVSRESNWVERAGRVFMTNYGPREITMSRGEGVRLWDSEGKEYLDFLGGIAVCSLGHCPPVVVKAIQEQAARLLHTSNFFLIEPQIELAEKLVETTGLDKCLFVNTGAESTEAAIKLARLYANKTYGDGKRPTVLTCTGSFHGRTYGAMSATASPRVRAGFAPLAPGFDFVEFNDVDDLRKKVDDTVCAILFETVQGEGGVRPVSQAFLSAARELADAKDLCLIVDEVQCGFSRSGHYFAWQGYEGVQPDVVPLAKAMGGGVPIGAILARGKWAEVFQPGNHGTTFGGNPLVTAAALAVCNELLTPKMLEHVQTISAYLKERLQDLASRHSVIDEIRGVGLMLGAQLNQPGPEVYKACLRRGLIINCTAQTVLRFVPPLIITKEDCDRAISILDEALGEIFK